MSTKTFFISATFAAPFVVFSLSVHDFSCFRKIEKMLSLRVNYFRATGPRKGFF